MQPYPFTPYLQATIAAAALLIGASALLASFSVWRGERNARLVEIGVNVLRADPKKEPTALAARQWALDLIDANAGGTKFSAEARRQLLQETLGYSGGGFTDYYEGGSYSYEPLPKNCPRVKNLN